MSLARHNLTLISKLAHRIAPETHSVNAYGSFLVAMDSYERVMQVTRDFSGIYCIENIDTGEKYIGRSKNIFKRWRKHIGNLMEGKHTNKGLSAAWSTGKFVFYIIELCDESSLDDREQHWISHFNTYEGKGYNETPGGDDVEFHRIHGFKNGYNFKKAKDKPDVKPMVVTAIDMLKQGQPMSFIAKSTGISLGTVEKIKKKKAYTDLSDGIEFPPTSPALRSAYARSCRERRRRDMAV